MYLGGYCMKRKSKKQIGTRLVYKLSHKLCTLLEINDTNFTVEFDDKSVKTYSLGSLESKFNLADEVNIDPVFVSDEKQDSDIIVGQVEVIIGEEDTNDSVQKQDNKQKQTGKLLSKDKKLSDYKLLVEQLSSQVRDMENVSKDYKKLVNENELLKEQINTVHKQDNERMEQINKVQQENKELSTQLKNVQSLILEKDNKLKDYEQIIKKLSSQVQNSDKLLNDCKKLIAENDILKEQVKTVHKQDNERIEQTDKLLQENDNLKNQIAELTEENKRLTAIINKPHAGGRPKKFSDNSVFEQMQKYKDKGESYRQIAKRFKCSSAYVFKVLNQPQG